MQKYFTQGTQLAELERLMTLPPGFRPRGGGRRMKSHRYTAEDCDCRYCIKKDSEFVIVNDSENEQWIFSPHEVKDWQGDVDWEASDDKLEFIKQSLSGGKYPHPDNNISFEVVEVNGEKWLLRCAFFIGGFYTGDINFCQAHIVYQDRYALYFAFNSKENTLEDQGTRDLMITILESWELVEILSF